ATWLPRLSRLPEPPPANPAPPGPPAVPYLTSSDHVHSRQDVRTAGRGSFEARPEQRPDRRARLVATRETFGAGDELAAEDTFCPSAPPPFEIRAQDLEDDYAPRAQAVEIRPSDVHRVGEDRQRFEN